MFNNPTPFPNWGGNVNVHAQINIAQPNIAPAPAPTPVKRKIKKSGTNGSHVVVIIDESGSMGPFRDETITGVNSYIGEQATTGNGLLTVATFSGNRVRFIRDGVALTDCAPISHADYSPTDLTNLHDAIGEVLTRVNASVPTRRHERPAIVVMIMTDGHENSSRTYSSEMVKELVTQCEKKEWSFMFLGANIDSFAAGSKLGMNASNTANYSMGNLSETIATASSVTSRLRSAKLAGSDNMELYAQSYFTNAERSGMGGDNA